MSQLQFSGSHHFSESHLSGSHPFSGSSTHSFSGSHLSGSHPFSGSSTHSFSGSHLSESHPNGSSGSAFCSLGTVPTAQFAPLGTASGTTSDISASDTSARIGCNSSQNSPTPSFPVQVCPSIWLGSFNTLTNTSFIDRENIQILIVCAPVHRFLNFFNDPRNNIVLPSNKIVLNLDPHFSVANLNSDERHLLDAFNKTYNKVLQNYLTFFYKCNDNLNYLMHSSPSSSLSINSPILSGNLITQFFNINRFIKLCKNIDSNISVAVISESGTQQLSTAVLISVLMDSYNYNLDASYNHIAKLVGPSILPFNCNYYDDLIVSENLKKFYAENSKLKLLNPQVLTTNYKLKRRNDGDDLNELNGCRGSINKRKFLYPRA